MNRRFARWTGPLLIVIPQLLLFVFQTDSLAPSTVVTYLSLTVAGVLFVLAGYWAPVAMLGHEVSWFVLAGLGDICLGVGFAATGLAAAFEPGRLALLYAGTATVGGLIIGYIGVDVARGGNHVRAGDGGD